MFNSSQPGFLEKSTSVFPYPKESSSPTSNGSVRVSVKISAAASSTIFWNASMAFKFSQLLRFNFFFFINLLLFVDALALHHDYEYCGWRSPSTCSIFVLLCAQQ